MPVTREQFRFGAILAVISAVIGILSALFTLYSQVSDAVGSVVAERIRQDFAPVGTVVSSVLPPVKFAEATGEKEGEALVRRKWILADGRSVNGTLYAIITNDRPVPNLQGMFMRGIDVTSPSPRQPGSVENYATALPIAKKFAGNAASSGLHQHGGGAARSNADKYSAGGKPYWVILASDTQPSGDHQHAVEINSGGDEETRPKNVAVYFYIKIN